MIARLSRDDALALGLIGLSVLWSVITYRGTASPDLMATWMAAEALASGQAANVYAPLSPVYTMLPPPDWLDRAPEGQQVFPYVYPPLWAALVAPLTKITEFSVFQGVALWLNPLLLGLTVWLAARMTAGGVRRWVFTAVGLVLLHFTIIGVTALDQDQPQILVSFLILLGLERASAGRPVLGGVAMALAAAIKLYPLFFALVWLLRGQWRAVSAFAVAGGLLAAISVSLAGWPLHETFLAHVRSIGNTAFANSFVFALDPIIARLSFDDALRFVPSTIDPQQGWQVLEKGAFWRTLSTAALLASILAMRFLQAPLAWAAFATFVGLLSPISWGYHYITAFAFLPALLAVFPSRGATLILVLALPVSTPFLIGLDRLANAFWLLPYIGTATMCAVAWVFLVAARKGGT